MMELRVIKAKMILKETVATGLVDGVSAKITPAGRGIAGRATADAEQPDHVHQLGHPGGPLDRVLDLGPVQQARNLIGPAGTALHLQAHLGLDYVARLSGARIADRGHR